MVGLWENGTKLAHFTRIQSAAANDNVTITNLMPGKSYTVELVSVIGTSTDCGKENTTDSEITKLTICTGAQFFIVFFEECVLIVCILCAMSIFGRSCIYYNCMDGFLFDFYVCNKISYQIYRQQKCFLHSEEIVLNSIIKFFLISILCVEKAAPSKTKHDVFPDYWRTLFI